MSYGIYVLRYGLLVPVREGSPYPPSPIPKKTPTKGAHRYRRRPIPYTMNHISYEDISHPYLTGSLPPTLVVPLEMVGEGMGGREIRGTGDTEIGYAMGYGIQNILAGIHLSSPIVTYQ